MVEAAGRAFAQATTLDDLRAAKQAHAGEHSPVALANRRIGDLPREERKTAGQAIGAARAAINQAYAEREAAVAVADLDARLVAEAVDVTLPVTLRPTGALHPVTALTYRMCDVFVAMGWEIAEGPEAEAEWLNFDALNFTPDHPARFLSDTLFLDPAAGHRILRTHTSPVQMRSLLTRELPVYVVAPGKVYRADEYDATHLPVFHQLEGLAVDKGLGMADLKGTLDHLARAMFGAETETRLRPHYFPFTEPSAEMDIRCFVCHGESVGNPARPCRTCKSEGWIEWGGCGVVNPRVLTAAGIDTDVYSGFAFGLGVDRTVMFRNNAADLRDFVEGDARFSRQLVGVAR
ncbi:MAG: phenylalanine--tRNA ligase subunit alpha [Propionibacteriaceae bacterium]|jgi:phenylalanyl-tRNA synthetase alpha chain|nr:phenylalanine--tRNA ligase subunit alpha [Propionibacteriaceae bacterium]